MDIHKEPENKANYTGGKKCGDVNNICDAFTCVGCYADTDDVRLLPCLHVACMTCVRGAIDSTRHAGKGTLLYSCHDCGHKANIVNMEGLDNSLKHLPCFMKTRSTNTCDNVMKCSNVNNHAICSSRGTETIPTSMETLDSCERPKCIESDVSCSHNQNGDALNGCSSVSGCSVCEECGGNMLHNELHHCSGCGKTICTACKDDQHGDHDIVPILDYIQNKVDYIQSLIGDISGKILKHKEGLSCIGRVQDYLLRMKESIRAEVVERTEYLISLVNQRKQTMLQELEESFTHHMDHYSGMAKSLSSELEKFDFVKNFSERLVKQGCDQDILQIHSDVTSQCLHRLYQIPNAKVDIVSMKLEIPGRGKEQATLDKLFGILKEGTVLSGSAQLVASFNVDLKWPTSIAISPGKEVVVAGKTGAFDSEGRALFFDGRGRFHSKLMYDRSHIPVDVRAAGDGTMWLSNSSGEIQNVTVAGRILRTVPGAFQGSGCLGALSDGSLIVSSGVGREIRVLNELGQHVYSVPIPGASITSENGDDLKESKSSKLSCLTTNSCDTIIIGDTGSCSILGLGPKGLERFTYSGINKEITLKCPSALCCDPFDNILIADFTSDSVHLLSKDGVFLGSLLGPENGLSCPNCLALDAEGHLYVGQYGGDILIYSYLSCSKKV